MRRSINLLRKIGCGLFAGLAMHVATSSAPAQELGQPVLPIQVKDAQNSNVLVIPINVTKTIGMTRSVGAKDDPIIEKLHNENPKVCKVQAIFNDPRHVLITGVGAGVSRITISGYDDPMNKVVREELIEIRVSSDDAVIREQQRRDLLEQIRKALPTANVDVVVGPNSTVVLSGWLSSGQDSLVLNALARGIFGQANITDTTRVGGVMQVEVDCTIAVVNRSKIRSMTFSWALNQRSYFVGSVLNAPSFTNTINSAVNAVTQNATATASNVTFGIVGDKGAFLGFLEALQTESMAKLHSEPKTVTLSGSKAEFVSGGETPIITSTGIGTPSVTYKNFGTSITVVPVVLGNGKIQLDIAAEVSSLNQAAGVNIAGTIVPGFDTRSSKNKLQIEDGHTLAIGGLIQHTTNASITKVPILGDLPFLGAAFSSKNFRDTEEELIILVTPRLVDPQSCNQLPHRLPTQQTRNADNFELFVEQLLELPRGQRQICGPDGRYVAGHKNGPTAGVFPCGDEVSCRHGLKGCATCGPLLRPGCSPHSGLSNCANGSSPTTCQPTAPSAPMPAPSPLPRTESSPVSLPVPAALQIRIDNDQSPIAIAPALGLQPAPLDLENRQ